VQARWTFSLYPQAGEGGGCLSVRRMVLPTGGPPTSLIRTRTGRSRPTGS